jgi:hypothetical protein
MSVSSLLVVQKSCVKASNAFQRPNIGKIGQNLSKNDDIEFKKSDFTIFIYSVRLQWNF